MTLKYSSNRSPEAAPNPPPGAASGFPANPGVVCFGTFAGMPDPSSRSSPTSGRLGGGDLPRGDARDLPLTPRSSTSATRSASTRSATARPALDRAAVPAGRDPRRRRRSRRRHAPPADRAPDRPRRRAHRAGQRPARPGRRRLGGIVEVRALENRALMLRSITTTFHGRDIFAPMAAHLAAGRPFAEVGPDDRPGSRQPSLPRADVRRRPPRDHRRVRRIFGNLRLAGTPADLARRSVRSYRGDGSCSTARRHPGGPEEAPWVGPSAGPGRDRC